MTTDAPDWTRPITVLSGLVISTQDFPDWTEAVVAVENTVIQGGAVADNTLPAGAFAQTIPRWQVAEAEYAPVSPALVLMSIFLLAATTIKHITWRTGSLGTTAPIHQWFGLYDNSLNQLATTTDDLTTAWNAGTNKTLAISQIAGGASSSFATTYTGLHYVGAYVDDTSRPPSYTGTQTFNATVCSLAPATGGTSTTGLTGPPAFPFTASAIANSTAMAWAYVS